MDDFNNEKEFEKENATEVESTPVENPQGSAPSGSPYSQPNAASSDYQTPYNNPTPTQDNPYYSQKRPYYYEPPINNEPQNPIYTQPPVNNDNTPYTPSPNFGNGEDGVPKKKKKKKGLAVIAVMLCICLVISVIGIFASNSKKASDENALTNKTDSAQATVKNSSEAQMKNSDGTLTTAGVYKKVVDSCVGVSVYSQQNNVSDFYSYFYGNGSSSQDSIPDGKETLSSEGSGVLMLEDKAKGLTYVMTCAHVISGGSKFTVTLNNGTEYNASLVGLDSQSDIGVLSVQATGLSIAEFGSSDDINVGEDCIAIGNPGGLEYANSVTKGIVSALNRPVSSSIGYDNECIQIDAAINPGNSGGALFNMQGQVIGINSSKIAQTEYEGMGFAVPSNTAVANANSIIANGYVAGRAKIGIQYTAITQYRNASSILSALEKKGFKDASGTMVINEVNSDSDLASKDIKEYDMIVAVNGKTMTSTDVMTSVLAECKPGDTIKLTIARIENNEIKTFEIDCKLIESKE